MTDIHNKHHHINNNDDNDNDNDEKLAAAPTIEARAARFGKGQMGSALMGSLLIHFCLTKGLLGYSR